MATLSSSPVLEHEQFVDELQELRKAMPRRAAEHPLIKAMERGEATEEQVKVQCIQQYFHTVGFVNGLTRLASRCDVPEVRREIAAGVYEEETGRLSGSAPHLELYFQYSRSWGFPPDKLRGGAYMIPETMALVNWYMYAADYLAPLEGIAAFTVGAEGVNVSFPGLPGLSRKICDAVTRHYGRTSQDAFFWELHDREDQEHSATGLRILARHANSEEKRERIRAAIRMTTDAWWHFVGGPLNWSVADCFSANSSAFY